MRFKNINIDIDGRVYRIVSEYQCRVFTLQIYGILSVIFFMYICCQLTYVPVTIIGNTIYAKVIAGTVANQGLPYKLCRMNNRLTVYETSNCKYVAFEGVTTISSDEKLPIITCLPNELQELEAHTGLNNLKEDQTSVLQGFDKIDGLYYTSVNDVINIVYDEPVMSIDKVTANLYCICTANESWLTPLIITDSVDPLQVGDTIVGFVAKLSDVAGPETISRHDDHIVITRDDRAIRLTRRALYYVEDDLSIIAYPTIKSNGREGFEESIIYGLREPRPFLQTGIRIVHPFHLPLMWDPLLPLMLVTTAIISQR